jgi:hypothetical protein
MSVTKPKVQTITKHNITMKRQNYLEIFFKCMKLQYPPLLQVFSSYCLHVASRKSVTGEKSRMMGRPEKPMHTAPIQWTNM